MYGPGAVIVHFAILEPLLRRITLFAAEFGFDIFVARRRSARA
jgi:hypothetical protein